MLWTRSTNSVSADSVRYFYILPIDQHQEQIRFQRIFIHLRASLSLSLASKYLTCTWLLIYKISAGNRVSPLFVPKPLCARCLIKFYDFWVFRHDHRTSLSCSNASIILYQWLICSFLSSNRNSKRWTKTRRSSCWTINDQTPSISGWLNCLYQNLLKSRSWKWTQQLWTERVSR